MATLEEAEARAWLEEREAQTYELNENKWGEWQRLLFVAFPKQSVFGKRLWGTGIYKRRNANKRIQYANTKEKFKITLAEGGKNG